MIHILFSSNPDAPLSRIILSIADTELVFNEITQTFLNLRVTRNGSFLPISNAHTDFFLIDRSMNVVKNRVVFHHQPVGFFKAFLKPLQSLALAENTRHFL